VLSSEEFARQLQLAAEEAQNSPQGQPAPSDREIEEWLRLFGGDNGPSQPDKK